MVKTMKFFPSALSGTVFAFFVVLLHVFALSSETIPYYQKVGRENVKYITVYLSGVPVEMIFDTGAAQILVNQEVYRRLGSPRTQDVRKANTVGGDIEIAFFDIPFVQWGGITMHNVRIAWYPHTELNLFGGDILKEFNYLIDEKQKTITFFDKNESIIFKELGERIEYFSAGGKNFPSSLEFRVKERE